MVVFGIQSTLFDFLTFGVLLLILNSSVDQFRTGWFTISIITEIGIMLIVRTRRIFYKSKPSKYLIISSIAVLVIALILPYSPFAGLLGIVVLPIWTNVYLMGLVILYITTAEMTKLLFYRQGISRNV